jgi:uncharacterized membrane protein YqjE
MNSFWQDAYDESKDKRYGALFFVTLLVIFGSLGILGLFAAIADSEYADDLVPALIVCAAIFAVALVCTVANWIRGRKYRKEALKYSTLSRDELAKARSKLKTRMQPVTFRKETRPPRRPPPRKPDTDLKY